MYPYAIGWCEAVIQNKVLSYNFYYWCIHSIIYVYCHNKCTNIYYLNPWALD